MNQNPKTAALCVKLRKDRTHPFWLKSIDKMLAAKAIGQGGEVGAPGGRGSQKPSVPCVGGGWKGGSRTKRSLLRRMASNVSMHGTPNTLQTSGILI